MPVSMTPQHGAVSCLRPASGERRLLQSPATGRPPIPDAGRSWFEQGFHDSDDPVADHGIVHPARTVPLQRRMLIRESNSMRSGPGP